MSGHGLVWQNGWMFPFNAPDAVGWKGGTGVVHTIINDSNHNGSLGQDLVLLMAQEVNINESFSYPPNPEIDKAVPNAEGKTPLTDMPVVGEFSPHPGVPSVLPERVNLSIPEPQKGYHLSNVVNAIAELDTIGEGELFTNATNFISRDGIEWKIQMQF